MSLYEKVISIGKPYLGPATETFIARQCKSRLKKEPADLMKSDLATLAKWLEIGGGLVMDPSRAAELAKKVSAL